MLSSESATPIPFLPDLTDWQETLQWVPNSAQVQQFQTLYRLVLEGNRQLNLTRITDPAEFAEKHLWDSLRGIQSFLQLDASTACRAIDIGTGAGFPGVPIAIVQPGWSVILLDSTRKKLTFLDGVLQTLELANATTLVGRAEEIGQQSTQREQYDLALVRAVAAASVCAEYALPLLKLGGQAVLYRGQWTDAEAQVLERAVTELGGKIETIESFHTPQTEAERHCLYVRKVAATPLTYPRATGIPAQNPLGGNVESSAEC